MFNTLGLQIKLKDSKMSSLTVTRFQRTFLHTSSFHNTAFLYQILHGFYGAHLSVTPSQFVRLDLQLSIEEEERPVVLASFTFPPLVFFFWRTMPITCL